MHGLIDHKHLREELLFQPPHIPHPLVLQPLKLLLLLLNPLGIPHLLLPQIPHNLIHHQQIRPVYLTLHPVVQPVPILDQFEDGPDELVVGAARVGEGGRGFQPGFDHLDAGEEGGVGVTALQGVAEFVELFQQVGVDPAELFLEQQEELELGETHAQQEEFALALQGEVLQDLQSLLADLQGFLGDQEFVHVGYRKWSHRPTVAVSLLVLLQRTQYESVLIPKYLPDFVSQAHIRVDIEFSPLNCRHLLVLTQNKWEVEEQVLNQAQKGSADTIH